MIDLTTVQTFETGGFLAQQNSLLTKKNKSLKYLLLGFSIVAGLVVGYYLIKQNRKND